MYILEEIIPLLDVVMKFMFPFMSNQYQAVHCTWVIWVQFPSKSFINYWQYLFIHLLLITFHGTRCLLHDTLYRCFKLRSKFDGYQSVNQSINARFVGRHYTTHIQECQQ